MHPERALRVINLLDIPENKRKFWPQEAAVFVRSSTHEIVDVIQFYTNSFSASEDYHRRFYTDCRAFFTRAGQFQSVADLEAKIEWCFQPITDSTYIVGHGLVGKQKTNDRDPNA